MKKVVAINGPSLVGGLNWVHLLRPLGYSVVAGPRSPLRLFYFYIFQKKNYRNIFWFLKFTVLYPYRPVEGRQAPCRPPAGR